MPRWNCSPLQRFVHTMDTSKVKSEKTPEFGPFRWLGTSYVGRRTTQPEPPRHWERLLDGSGRRVSKVNEEMWTKFYKAISPFPVFYVDGKRYNALRWLFFQMYDDIEKYPDDQSKDTDIPWDAHAKKAWSNNPNHKAWDRENAPGKYRGYNLHLHQQQLIVCMMIMNPHTGKPRKQDALYWHYRDIDNIRSSVDINYYPDLTIVKWYDWRANTRRKSRKGKSEFQKIDLIFPEVRGYERLTMVRHYLNGGTDRDNPFL